MVVVDLEVVVIVELKVAMVVATIVLKICCTVVVMVLLSFQYPSVRPLLSVKLKSNYQTMC